MYLDESPSNSVTQPGLTVDAFFFTDSRGRHPRRASPSSIQQFDTGSEENPQDIAQGEAFAAQVVNAVLVQPILGDAALLLVWLLRRAQASLRPRAPAGGDNTDAIAPILSPGASAYDGFARYGFRVRPR